MEDQKKAPESEETILEFPTESVYDIGDRRYIVTAHFDDSREDLKTKVTRLLKEDASKMVQPAMPDES